MSKKQLIAGLMFASLFGGIVALGGYKLFEKDKPGYISTPAGSVQFSSYIADSSYNVPEGLNFVHAAELVTPVVVHIKSTMSMTAQNNPHQGQFDDMLKDFFGDPNRGNSAPREAQSAGSGVIISENGYIVTNNHVIENANEIGVTLHDNREYKATLVGTDANTDIAVLKIEEKGLPFGKFGDSDRVRIGEWVLAVGNPFELTSTVTAGIVSAKARNIGILRNRYGIESFIQTDAAVNPGNSGGALVNLRGELIGINTAIATPTGTFAGYSFAVPSTLVKKVVDDLVEFGMVQRAVLGIEILDLKDPRMTEDLKILSGVYVDKVNVGSAAEEAGLKKGDVIVEINKTKVTNVAELQGLVARNRPGDKVEVTFLRDEKTKTVFAKLKNLDNEVKIVRKEDGYSVEGGSLRNATVEELKAYEAEGGVIIENVGSGKWQDAGIKDGFLITSVNNSPVKDVIELRNILRASNGDGVLIKGKYSNGKEAYYGMGW